MKEELARIGYIGERGAGAHPIGAYFEAHIEQGPGARGPRCHDRRGPGVLGIRWYDRTVTGMEAHAGPTPMALRKDALQVATASCRRWPRSRTATRRTAAARSAWCKSIRTAATSSLASAFLDRPAQRSDALVDTAGRRDAGAWWPRRAGDRLLIRSSSSPTIRAAVSRRVRRQSAAPPKARLLVHAAVSGAGHDAVYAARLAPAGMIFIPCKDGISHNEIEDAKPEHIEAGGDVLLHAMLERAVVTS